MLSTSVRPYGVAITQAIASGDLDTMKQVAALAETHIDTHGDVATALYALKIEIAKIENKKS